MWVGRGRLESSSACNDDAKEKKRRFPRWHKSISLVGVFSQRYTHRTHGPRYTDATIPTNSPQKQSPAHNQTRLPTFPLRVFRGPVLRPQLLHPAHHPLPVHRQSFRGPLHKRLPAFSHAIRSSSTPRRRRRCILPSAGFPKLGAQLRSHAGKRRADPARSPRGCCSTLVFMVCRPSRT